MYVSPRHPDYERLRGGAPQPTPEQAGQPLATLDRPGGRYGPDTELRVVLDEYQSHRYISIRVWSKGPDGEMYPTRKGVSIKVREAERVAAALVEAARLAGQGGEASKSTPGRREPQRPGGPTRPPAQPGRRPGRPTPLIRPDFTDDGFDEFTTN